MDDSDDNNNIAVEEISHMLESLYDMLEEEGVVLSRCVVV